VRAEIPRLSCRGLSLAVAGRALATGLDFDVRAGECWAIIGPNGAGKTTLVTTLAALGPRERARIRGFLPQDSVDYFPATVLETALVGRHPHLARWQWESAADVERVHAALSAFGLAGLDARDARTLSGGERRRLALAALVAQDPALLLLDEPSSHLDLGQQIAALDTVSALARNDGRAIVMVLHDLHLALRYADHAIALGGGRTLAGAASDVMSEATLSALFGHRLISVGDGTTRTLLPI
jgi:iron complex transport system ATP-binding protein